MGHVEGEPLGGRELVQDLEEGKRVRPARDPDDDPGAARQEVVRRAPVADRARELSWRQYGHGISIGAAQRGRVRFFYM
jgi:hypothetical protein